MTPQSNVPLSSKDGSMSHETFVCDCADIPPTMPTCRGEHLWDCPVAAHLRLVAFETSRRDGTLDREFAPVREAMQTGDTATVVEWLGRDNAEKAKAAAARARHRRAA